MYHQIYLIFIFYFVGEETVITRGTWFYESNWQPVDVELSEPIETIHLTQFLGKKPSEIINDTGTPKKSKYYCMEYQNIL